MLINTSIINGMAVYYSHLIRPHPKPMCNIPNIIINNPNIFKNPEFCTSCNCKFTCRYTPPPGHDKLEYAFAPQTIKNNQYQAPILDEVAYEDVYAHELMAYDDEEKIAAVKTYPKTQSKSKFEF